MYRYATGTPASRSTYNYNSMVPFIMAGGANNSASNDNSMDLFVFDVDEYIPEAGDIITSTTESTVTVQREPEPNVPNVSSIEFTVIAVILVLFTLFISYLYSQCGADRNAKCGYITNRKSDDGMTRYTWE